MANYSKEELQYIASQVKPYLLELVRANGLDVDNIEVVEDTDGITSLPAYDNRGGTKKVVRVPLSTFAKPAQDAADELMGNITAAGEAANNANIAAENANTAASEINSLKGSIDQAVDDAQKALVDSQTALENITQKSAELDESEASRSEAEQSRSEAEQLRTSEFDSLKTQMEASIDELDTATESAIDTAEHPTYIGEDNYVYKWDKETKSYNKTDIYVKGEGFSISKVWTSKAAQNADTSSYKEGSFGLINTGDVENPDNAQLYVYNNGKWEFLVDMSGAIGFTGKTPQLSIGNVAKGTEAAVSLSGDGTDAEGNPKYKLNLVLPQGEKGDDGLEPILEVGSVTTSAPNTSASAEIIENGFSANGNPKYLLNLTIPKGEKGENGEGAGNVLVGTSNLVSGKTYLFKPSQNNSAEGTFVEYEPPQIDTSTLATKDELSSGLSGKADKTSLAAVATSGSYNDLNDKPTIPSAVTESTVSGWGFTKNTGTYSKPSGGIPKSDLASVVQTSLGKADTALQSHQDISGKQDKLVSGTNIKTINNESILGSGNITITGGGGGTITGVSVNGTPVATSGVADIPAASTSKYGVTKLSSSTSSTSTALAATASAVKAAYDLANSYKGTVTGVKINGSTKSPSNGTVDIGTVLTRHQTIKTINGNTITGSGNVNTEYPVVINATGTVSMKPNTYYRVIQGFSTLTVTFQNPTYSDIVNEYVIEFVCGGTVSIPDTIVWASGKVPTFEVGKTYLLSVVNNLGLIAKFE